MTLLLIYLAAALAFSFYCSIAEAVVLSVRPAFIKSLEGKHPRQARRLKSIRDNLDQTLAAILSLNTIAHTVGAVGAGGQAAIVFGNAYVGVVSAILTLLILVVSEIIPKTLGATYWRRLAPALTGSLVLLVKLMGPFVWLSQYVTRLLRPHRRGPSFTSDEFAAMVDIGQAEGVIASDRSRMLKTLLRLDYLDIRAIMTPRQVVFSLPASMTVAEFVSDCAETPFSRIPVFGDSPDDVLGFVLKTDVLLSETRDQGDKPLRDLMREMPVVPDRVTFPNLFDRLLQEKVHIALVIDEYGSVEGLVTLEDVVETLIGLEIVDETDTIEDMQSLAHRRWEDRARRLGIDPTIVSRSDSDNDPPSPA